MFKTCLYGIILLSIIVSAYPVPARTIGLGVIVGRPTGFSAKFWQTRRVAMGGALALYGGNPPGGQVHADFLLHTLPQMVFYDLELYLYIGAGLQLTWAEKSQAGFRLPLGADYMFNRYPLDIFTELVPVFDIESHPDIAFDMAFGVRYNFK